MELVIARRPIGRRKTAVLPDGLWAEAAIQSSRAPYDLLDRHALALLGLAMTALDQPQIIPF